MLFSGSSFNSLSRELFPDFTVVLSLSTAIELKRFVFCAIDLFDAICFEKLGRQAAFKRSMDTFGYFPSRARVKYLSCRCKTLCGPEYRGLSAPLGESILRKT